MARVIPMSATRIAAFFLAVLLPASVGLAQAVKSTAPPKNSPAKTVTRSAEAWTPEAMQWGGTRTALPANGLIAVLSGNPDLTKPYALRVKVPDGIAEGPHWHGTDVQITVLQGTLLFGVGSAFDETKLQKLGPGSFVNIPAGLRHFEASHGETVYQMQGTGPLRTFTPRVTARPALTSTAAAAEAQRQRAEFDAAVVAFNRAVDTQDRSALNTTVRQEFDRIARGGGPYAPTARDYVNNRIPAELVFVTRGPCPAIGRAADVGWVVQDVKPGDVVAPALLDQKLEWTACAWPEFPPRAAGAAAKSGVVRLSVTLNERGAVMSVSARGGLYPPGVYESAAAAVRGWRTNPPRAKGQPVKTEVSVDIPFSQ